MRELTTDTTTKNWTWVQKYKGWSLARTIGTLIGVSPGLLGQIYFSREVLSLYEEMLPLQKIIDAASSKGKSELCRHMDKTHRRMKDDPIWRRIIDLRGKPPLDINDVVTIEQYTGRPLVLMNWLYLPPLSQQWYRKATPLYTHSERHTHHGRVEYE
jgi:hypothetical protein